MNRLAQHLHDQAQARLRDFVRARYTLIKPVPTQGLFNFRCFHNVVQYALDHEGLGVAEVIYLDPSPVLHYVNHDPATGCYLETTLGFRAPHLEYYLLRHVHPDDFQVLHSEFDRALDSWTRQFTSPWARWLGVERIL